jgi:hypothetical protein
MTRSFKVVSKSPKELYAAVSTVAVVAYVIVVNLIIARPCTDYASLFSHSSWCFVSKYYAAEVKAKSITNLVSIGVVLEGPS